MEKILFAATNDHLSASRGRSNSSGKKAFSSAFRPPLSLCCISTAVNSFVAAVNASSYGDMQFRSSAKHSGCRSCSQNCSQPAVCQDHIATPCSQSMCTQPWLLTNLQVSSIFVNSLVAAVKSSVPVGTTQRRPGLHIEIPRKVTVAYRTLKRPTTLDFKGGHAVAQQRQAQRLPQLLTELQVGRNLSRLNVRSNRSA